MSNSTIRGWESAAFNGVPPSTTLGEAFAFNNSQLNHLEFLGTRCEVDVGVVSLQRFPTFTFARAPMSN